MEDIENKEGADKQEQPEEEEEDEEKTILTVDCKMGAEETKIREKIAEIAKRYNDDEQLDIESKPDMAKIDKTLAEEVQKMMNGEFGKNWSVVVGKRFAMGVGLRENDKFGNFKIGRFNVLVFQCNQTEAK
jgi:hypothetical protein